MQVGRCEDAGSHRHILSRFPLANTLSVFVRVVSLVVSCKSPRSQLGKLLPASGLQIPEICLRNIVAQGSVCDPPPEVSLGLHGLCVSQRS